MCAELLHLRDLGVVIYGIDNIDKTSDAEAWLDRYGDPYRLVLFDRNGVFARNMGLYGTPETYLIDSSDRVRRRHIGQITRAVADDLLKPWQGMTDAQPNSANFLRRLFPVTGRRLSRQRELNGGVGWLPGNLPR